MQIPAPDGRENWRRDDSRVGFDHKSGRIDATIVTVKKKGHRERGPSTCDDSDGQAVSDGKVKSPTGKTAHGAPDALLQGSI